MCLCGSQLRYSGVGAVIEYAVKHLEVNSNSLFLSFLEGFLHVFMDEKLT